MKHTSVLNSFLDLHSEEDLVRLEATGVLAGRRLPSWYCVLHTQQHTCDLLRTGVSPEAPVEQVASYCSYGPTAGLTHEGQY